MAGSQVKYIIPSMWIEHFSSCVFFAIPAGWQRVPVFKCQNIELVMLPPLDWNEHRVKAHARENVISGSRVSWNHLVRN